eukprot:TRINITY_DN631_c0_g1_i2.p3 TRINITY_DN631_c0_g1~~TRINITY_DN631_c0_g1_i2.p3  ORF type:complete len:227 (+),score=41.65 TRINITY_DN631_c0_g1_i2:480-1160(+)
MPQFQPTQEQPEQEQLVHPNRQQDQYLQQDDQKINEVEEPEELKYSSVPQPEVVQKQNVQQHEQFPVNTYKSNYGLQKGEGSRSQKQLGVPKMSNHQVEYDYLQQPEDRQSKSQLSNNQQQQLSSYRDYNNEQDNSKLLYPLPDSFNDNGKSFSKAKRVLITEQMIMKTPGPGYYGNTFANKQSPTYISFTKSPRKCVFDELSKTDAPDKFYDTKIRFLSKKLLNN